METLCHPRPRPRRGARRLAARGARADRRPPPLPLRHGSGHRRGLDSSRRTRDEDRPAGADERRPRPASRRRPLPRPARLGPGGRVRRGREALVRPRSGPRPRGPRGGDRVRADTRDRAPARLRRDPPGGTGALEPLLDDGRGDRPLGKPRSPLARARAPDRPVAVLDRDPVLRAVPAAGDGADLQQLGGQVPPGDALVARRALRAVGPSSAARAQPRLLRRDPAAGAGDGKAPGLLRRPVAQDDQPERRGVAVERRAVPRLAAASPDLLRRARPPGAWRSGHPRAVPRGRLRDGGVHGVLRRRGTRPGERYVLGPPLQGAQEIFPKDRTVNTTFELAYWRWGLETAQRWRERLGLGREPRWQRVLDRLSPLPVRDGRYLFAETAPESFDDPRWARDHPSVLGAFGMLPGDGVDVPTMQRTFDWIWSTGAGPTRGAGTTRSSR